MTAVAVLSSGLTAWLLHRPHIDQTIMLEGDAPVSGRFFVERYDSMEALEIFLTELEASAVQASGVRQPDTSTSLTHIAFGSCAFQSVPQPIFRQVVASNPDLYISLGDAIYGDYDIETKTAYEVTPETLRREWQVLADNPDWQHLVQHVPVMAIWDNHDYGHHSAGAEFPLKTESAEIFLDFFSEPADSERRRRPGVYDAKIFGPEGRKVQIILLDTRSFKTFPVLSERQEGAGGSLGKYAPDMDPQASLLGDTQWQWLERELKRPANVRLIASSGQVVADEKGMDEWGNYPLERERLLTMIASIADGRSVLLSGNVHFSEVSSVDVASRRLTDFTSSGLTHVNREYPQAPNSYRVAGPSVDLNFGLVEIDWANNLEITLKSIGVDGQVHFEYRVPPESDALASAHHSGSNL
jgi:alkaline phosphatase D